MFKTHSDLILFHPTTFSSTQLHSTNYPLGTLLGLHSPLCQLRTSQNQTNKERQPTSVVRVLCCGDQQPQCVHYAIPAAQRMKKLTRMTGREAFQQTTTRLLDLVVRESKVNQEVISLRNDHHHPDRHHRYKHII